MNAESLKYTKDHEWVNVEGNIAYVGISDFAQHSLGDIVFVELPKNGAIVTANKVFASVESVKAVSDIICPVSGKVVKTNDALNDEPQLLNEAPYENWVAAIELSNVSELETLLGYADYEDFCKKQ